ncbi:hypothetical protein AURDEDRAFT_172013 [Auricularia subglabra TFB-10046 SS5]|nr:hypothetical protein AURDEDRAFT_172013 [Auricularia subglabra TFB-10046 SS5]
MSLRLVLVSLDTAERINGRALLDSGCTSSSSDREFIRRKQLTTQPAAVVWTVYNADGSVNGFIKEYVELLIKIRDADGREHVEKCNFPVANLGGKQDLFLGYD